MRFLPVRYKILTVMEILYFVIIALMRVLQSNCSKRASGLIGGKMTFFHYAGYYNTVSAAIGLVALAIAGFSGFTPFTLLCAAGVGIFLAVDLFANLNAVKRCTLSLVTLFSMGGLIIPCIFGIFLFDEPMSLWQWGGLLLFIVSACFMISGSGATYGKFSFGTLLLLLTTFLANGAVMVLQKLFAVKEPDGNVFFFSFLTFAVNAVILYAVMLAFSLGKDNKIERLDKKLYLFGALLAAAVFTISTVVTLAAKTVPSVVLFPVSSAITMTVSTVVGAICFKEKITVKNIAGLVLGLGAMLVINLL